MKKPHGDLGSSPGVRGWHIVAETAAPRDVQDIHVGLVDVSKRIAIAPWPVSDML